MLRHECGVACRPIPLCHVRALHGMALACQRGRRSDRCRHVGCWLCAQLWTDLAFDVTRCNRATTFASGRRASVVAALVLLLHQLLPALLPCGFAFATCLGTQLRVERRCPSLLERRVCRWSSSGSERWKRMAGKMSASQSARRHVMNGDRMKRRIGQGRRALSTAQGACSS